MGMGTIIEFPADAASRRLGSSMIGLILPVVRIERGDDEASDGSGPEEGAASGSRRRRR
jgi:hypothetical protein